MTSDTGPGSYLIRALTPQTVATRAKRELTPLNAFLYCSFIDNKMSLFKADDKQWQNLGPETPLFLIATDSIIYAKDIDAVAFIRRTPTRPDGSQNAYGGRLAFPGGFLDAVDTRATPTKNEEQVEVVTHTLRHQLSACVKRELAEEAPELAKAIAERDPVLQGFVSNTERDIRHLKTSKFLPVTSAVFLSVIQKEPENSGEGADDAQGHRVIWVKRDVLKDIGQKYKPNIHNVTFQSTDMVYGPEHHFKVDDFAFDHVLVAQQVLNCLDPV
jgi:ADP-ribose pyrophosphatase YjhB (NUDIX family)